MCTNDERPKMIPRSREVDFPTKQEAGRINYDGKTTRASSSSAAPWLKSKDPRIVRVSRAFGTKDRHSKVCTVRGLRDRRVRLSVPTAIQLYDLQDRLGLNQPSKVVDWLLNAAKNEIDELPPLQMPPGNFIQNHHSFLPSHQDSGASQSNRSDGSKINNGIDWEDQPGLPRLNLWNSSTLLRSKSKEVERATADEKENWTKRNEEEKQEGIDNIDDHGAQVSSSNFFPRNNHSSLQGLLNSVMPYGSYYHLEPSNFTFSQLGSHGITSQQTDQQDLQNFNVLPLQPTLSLPTGSTTHVLVCPQGATAQAYFPSHIPAASTEFDPRQLSHFHMLSSTSSQNPLSTSITPPSFSVSQSVRPFQLSMTTKHNDSQNDNIPSQPNKDI